MPLTTYHYTCGHTRHVQGRECSCIYDQLLRINERRTFYDPDIRYVPFNYSGNCRHNRDVMRPHECRDCRHYRERERAAIRARLPDTSRRYGLADLAGRSDLAPFFYDSYRSGPWWYGHGYGGRGQGFGSGKWR
ncbi:hypothetical protein CLAFUW4_04963 [Fulvia fulva]|uniref:Uncharacterized protein n=1 Tax=Passalora fulva TaxID=5499 RepID=A0A9Q8PIX0_PASFU|nr:uncharacterized protein CLAFUR5_11943 [Fulvia fulva]KAK4626406.1 hypothetical protein CLAFUR4_04949 [Fulvia fulva]KAK4628471.1 hypothetical protein CLAFUR0_04953 [Fulvia fulva]UJO23242.1 hypothetical protein CLAFUR5_11943 [Fulvia fulva]WPV13835.1 hypothetical protein CLAFUW4_04963 [Fulvia fulva]WPV28739.1 hypothetical protein CLAFUW7_04957 [Fulvia fulva]